MDSINFCSLFGDLEVISNTRFTSKEIDVMACLVNGRSAKFIGQLLNVAPKTVESHIRNIKIKLDCSPKEQVISFIEKSDKHLLIGKHYIGLLIDFEFEKLLRKISSIGEKIAVFCSFKDGACPRLLRHLNLCGISISNNSGNVLNCDPNNYHHSFLELIQKFAQSSHIDKLIDEFKTFYESKITGKYIREEKTSNQVLFFKYRKHITSITIALFLAISGFIYTNYEPGRQIRMDLPTINENVLLKRHQIIDKIDSVLDSKNGIKIAVLTGCGGAGKTTLAREYIRSQKANVVWEINAETENSMFNSFIDLASAIAQSREQKDELSIIKSISDPNERNEKLLLFISKLLKLSGKWIITFDNASNFTNIKKYFPYDHKVWGNGKLLITTRNATISNNAAIPAASVIEVGYINLQEQEKLFFDVLDKGRAAPSFSYSKTIKNFLKSIPPYPLDTFLAASYIKNTQVSLDDYLSNTKSISKNFEKLQQQFLFDGTNYGKTRFGIISTTFKQIIKCNNDFKELLLLLCLLDSQNIPIDYFKQCKENLIVNEFIYLLKNIH